MIPDTENVPLGIAKTKALGLKNVIIETDISGGHIDFDRFPLEKYFLLVKKWLTWIHDEIDENSKVFVNLRDLKDIMPTEPKRCYRYVDFLSKLEPRIRPFGLMIEDPAGTVLPEECGNWAQLIRKTTARNQWNPHLLIHVHERYNFGDVTSFHVSNIFLIDL